MIFCDLIFFPIIIRNPQYANVLSTYTDDCIQNMFFNVYEGVHESL